MRVKAVAVAAVVFWAWLGPTLAGASARAGASTPLIDAVKQGDREAMRRLLAERAVDARAVESDGTTALHWAARGDDLVAAELLVRAGADVNAGNRYGVTPLSLAALNGSAEMLEVLLAAGANPDTASPEGETVLMTAARTGRAGAVRALLARGAEVNATERWFDETALMWAAAENHPDVVALLVDHGAEMNRLARVVEFPATKVDNATMVITALPRGGLSALMLAARQGALESTQALIEAGADLNLTDPDGTSALVLAIINAHYDVAAALVKGGADLNVADVAGMTPVYAAVDMHTMDPLINRPPPKPSGALDSVDVVKLLLEHGADPDARLKSPLLMRQHNGGNALFGEGATALMRAARSSDLAMMRLLLEHGADAGAATANGATVLMFASGLGRNARLGGTDEQAMEAIALCLEGGADIDAVDRSGQTALHIAVARGDAVVEFLAERGAKLDVRDQAGRTPLDVALGVAAGGRGGRGGRGAGPAPVRESTAALLRMLMEGAATPEGVH